MNPNSTMLTPYLESFNGCHSQYIRKILDSLHVVWMWFFLSSLELRKLLAFQIEPYSFKLLFVAPKVFAQDGSHQLPSIQSSWLTSSCPSKFSSSVPHVGKPFLVTFSSLCLLVCTCW